MICPCSLLQSERAAHIQSHTLPWPQRTNVPMKAMFLLCEIPPLDLDEGIISVVLLAGSVSPVKLDSSIFKSTA